MKREDIVKKINKKNLVGVELGVASGCFSKKLVETNKFKEFYCIDKWNDHHSVKEYYGVHRYFKQFSEVNVLRSSFDEAIDLFPSDYFDFIYIDGYAHTGQDDGTTLHKWYEKLKVGGIYSGHDYHTDWSATIRQVDLFVEKFNLKLNLTTETDEYPSWWCIKTT